MTSPLPITSDPDSDQLLADNPLALLLGMLLDQQVSMEVAFRGPSLLFQRLDGLDAATIAAMNPVKFAAVCSERPAVHRFPGAMAKRIQQVCAVVVAEYDGAAENLWVGVEDGRTLVRRVRDLPGFGEEKSKIFVALLAKRFGVRPVGWEQAAAPFSDDQPRSVADVADAESLQAVREWKKKMKAAKKSKQEMP